MNAARNKTNSTVKMTILLTRNCRVGALVLGFLLELCLVSLAASFRSWNYILHADL
jgi:hypothetical protein